VKIQIPNTFLPEKKYIVDTFFSEFLALDYSIEISESKNYKVILDNKNFIEIEDAFWGNLDENTGYLHKENIPKTVTRTKNEFFDDELIIIYGNDKLEIDKNRIYCGIDIFASAFFILSRWEEAVFDKKDKHGRFPCELSLAQRNNFQYKAIVNEYVEMLWNMLVRLGCNQQRKTRKFQIIPTHDVDTFLRFINLKTALKAIVGDIVKRKSLKTAIESTSQYIKFKFNLDNDPFDTFDYLMNISEKYGVKSHFYFIAGKIGEYDVNYNFLNQEVKKTIFKIIEKGHFVGIHGSYNSFDNESQYLQEANRFKSIGIEPYESRQHYLRLKIPETWHNLIKAKIKIDSSIAFTNDSGFRAGVCYEYKLFDVKQRKILDLKEQPLIFMETTTRFKYNTPEKFFKHLNHLKKVVKKFKGQFVFLWHNSNINNFYWKEFSKNYKSIFEDTD